ncbi:MAG: DUF4403 family protein [Hyphomicrobiaceae bacterium]
MTRIESIRLLKGGFAAMLCTVLAGCQEPVEFTRKPVEKSQEGGQPSVRAPVFVVARTDSTSLNAEIAARIPDRILRVKRWISKAACVEKNGRKRCASARVTGDITRSGEIQFAGTASGLIIHIPVTYRFDVRGSGVARDVEETATGQFVLKANYTVSLDDTWQANVSYRDKLAAADAKNIRILERTIDLAKPIKRKLRSTLRRLASTLQGALDTTSISSGAVEEAWRHLHYPVQLMKEPALWIRGEPQSITSGGLNVVGDTLEFRVAIDTDIRTYTGKRPVPLIAQNMPGIEQGSTIEPASRLIMPVDLSYAEIASRIKNALEKAGPIKPETSSKADSFKIQSVRLFPVSGRLALAVSMETQIKDHWQSLSGTTYVLGTPTVEKGTARLGLKLAEFSAPTPSPSMFDNGRFILPEKPLVDAFRKGMEIGLKERFASVLGLANQATQGNFATDSRIRGRFDDLKVHSIETHSDGLRINLDLVGALSIYPGAGKIASGPGTAEKSSLPQ